MQNQKLSIAELENLLGYYKPQTCKDTTDVIDCLFILSKQPQTAQMKKLAERFVKRYGLLRTSNSVADMNYLDRERWHKVTNFYTELFFGVTETKYEDDYERWYEVDWTAKGDDYHVNGTYSIVATSFDMAKEKCLEKAQTKIWERIKREIKPNNFTILKIETEGKTIYENGILR